MPILRNHKHERFCQEMLVDDNATKAYVRTGYKNTPAARTAASKLLAKDNISTRIEELRNKRSSKLEMNADWILQNLIKIVEFSMPAGPLSIGQSSVKVYKIDLSYALKALDMIGRHIGFFNHSSNDKNERFGLSDILMRIEESEKEEQKK